jgi:DNA-binding response OmpR family regulator
MRILLSVADPAIADQIRVGLEAFGDVQVDQDRGVLALAKLRGGEYDALFLALDPAAPDAEELLEKVRGEPTGADVVVVGHEAAFPKLREDKVRGRIFALLAQPLVPVEFFRTVSRLRQKRATARAR